jgi:hypothetical protein
MGRTFAVSNVKLAKQPKPSLDRTAALAKLLSQTSELASAPVKLFDVRTRETVETRFVAGMFGVVETRDVLAPEFGWAVVYA